MIAIVAGEALFLGSARIADWALVVLAINQAYFVLSEEPGLARRFGSAYATYKASVPRWLPRWTAWKPSDQDSVL